MDDEDYIMMPMGGSQALPTEAIKDLSISLKNIASLLSVDPSENGLATMNLVFNKCLNLMNYELDIQLSMHDDFRREYYANKNRENMETVVDNVKPLKPKK